MSVIWHSSPYSLHHAKLFSRLFILLESGGKVCQVPRSVMLLTLCPLRCLLSWSFYLPLWVRIWPKRAGLGGFENVQDWWFSCILLFSISRFDRGLCWTNSAWPLHTPAAARPGQGEDGEHKCGVVYEQSEEVRSHLCRGRGEGSDNGRCLLGLHS